MNTQKIAPARLIDTGELAEQIGNQKNTIEGWRLKGIGPRYLAIGRLIRYRQSDVDDWLESRIRTSTSDNRPETAITRKSSKAAASQATAS